jgi:hypothetical protein
MLDLSNTLPMAVMIDEDGMQELVVPINAQDVAPGIRTSPRASLTRTWVACFSRDTRHRLRRRPMRACRGRQTMTASKGSTSGRF